jgi:sorbitol-specific phosphotransferase system component IIBC
MFEPGRVIVGNAGVLLTKVIWVKPGVILPHIMGLIQLNVIRSQCGCEWVKVGSCCNCEQTIPHQGHALRPSAQRTVP